MDEYSLPVAISALANTIAAQTQDDIELALISAVFNQLGDTLATILAVRALEQERKEKHCE